MSSVACFKVVFKVSSLPVTSSLSFLSLSPLSGTLGVGDVTASSFSSGLVGICAFSTLTLQAASTLKFPKGFIKTFNSILSVNEPISNLTVFLSSELVVILPSTSFPFTLGFNSFNNFPFSNVITMYILFLDISILVSFKYPFAIESSSELSFISFADISYVPSTYCSIAVELFIISAALTVLNVFPNTDIIAKAIAVFFTSFPFLIIVFPLSLIHLTI